MLERRENRIIRINPAIKPKLLIVVDTEEEFDWSKPHDRRSTGVSHIRHQERAHRIYEKFGLKPTYVMDYPVASQEDGYKPLLELYRSNACTIGAHLHPWVSPPYREKVSAKNSYPGNLPRDLEHEKLRLLTEEIAGRFGTRPTVYRAGRYGVGPNTADILEDLKYEIDTSISPGGNFADDGGPVFEEFNDELYWFGKNHNLLEIPLTCGFTGFLSGRGESLYPQIMSKAGMVFRLPGIFSRLGLLERLRLTPEGYEFEHLWRITRAFHQRGQRIFVMSYHSPSLAEGYTPYVQNAGDLAAFLERIEKYLDYFCGELGGEPATPDDILAIAKRSGNQ